MRIRLDQIGEEPARWRESPVIAAADLERLQLVGLGPVSWAGQVADAGSNYLLSARLEYEQELSCPRCLKSSTVPVAADVQLMIVGRSEEPMAGEHLLDRDDLDTYYVEEDVLDTDPILLEQMQLNIPMRHLCREECRGLCPTCGADLNIDDCSCAPEAGDPRWQALAGLRESLES